MAQKAFHIAQVNIGRLVAPLDDPQVSGFVERLDEINALADSSPGFVWRLKGDNNNATYVRPYDDDTIMVNMSVWESLDYLREYVYRSQHSELIKRRKDWFQKFDGAFMALWWVPAGHIPTTDEAKDRLEYLRTQGDSPYAFSFKTTFAPEDL